MYVYHDELYIDKVMLTAVSCILNRMYAHHNALYIKQYVCLPLSFGMDMNLFTNGSFSMR